MSAELALHLSAHFFASIFAGYLIWKIWQKPAASFLAAIAGGVFVDLDHFIDYYFVFGFDLRWDYFFNGYQFLKSGKDYIFFHGWEYVLILFFLLFVFKNKSAKSVVLGLALGMFFHLSLDSALNGLPVRSYSIIERAKNNFEAEKLVEPERKAEYLLKRQIIKF
ncbi:MAG: hypothetical protein A3H02_02610 [Candidatus Niyogibacteria bacterium RIFCSPLOWO2_12_FULL_41_13]|uniref:Uncharacterized protein n=1 Tax=Candidatus Niyogibacteria bacterium RIFCSPLOWO2_12_FULL_41_13 TaxID=1801726 RepID=A0A1G2F0D2_9BACT|nr:MAG: hypothetical protein A3H02_02610 [Candidatus Niyogibacteria bacterium RIFCSPLOWO2_12_FULL_41_13]